MSESVNVVSEITVRDSATAAVGQIKKSFLSLKQSTLDVSGAVNSSLTRGAFGGLSGATANLGGALRNLGGHFGGVISGIKSLAAPLLAAAGIGGIAALTASITKYVSAAATIGRVAPSIGATVEQFQKLAYAADMADVSQETFTSNMRRLQTNIASAGMGGNKKLAALFDRLKIKMLDGNNQIRSAADLLPELTEAFRINTNEGTRSIMGKALFGKAWADMLPLLAQGKNALAAYGVEAEKDGLITKEQIEDAEDAQHGWKSFSAALQGLSNTISASLLPVLTPLIYRLRDFARELRANPEFQKFLQSVSDTISNFDFTRLRDSLVWLGEKIKVMVGVVGGWQNAMIAIIAIMNGSLIAALLNVGLALLKLGAVVLLNPLGLLITSIAAVILAAILLWKNWDQVKTWLGESWETIKGLASSVWGSIADFFAEVGTRIAGNVRAVWTGIKDFFTGIWDSIESLFTAVVPKLLAKISELIPDSIKAAWGDIEQFFKTLWDGVVATFESVWGRIKPIVDLITGAVQPVINLMQKATGLFKGMGGPEIGGAVGQAPQAPGPGYTGPLGKWLGMGRDGAGGPVARQEAATGGAAGAPGAAGKVQVEFANMPQGATVKTEGSGIQTKVDTGRSMADAL